MLRSPRRSPPPEIQSAAARPCSERSSACSRLRSPLADLRSSPRSATRVRPTTGTSAASQARVAGGGRLPSIGVVRGARLARAPRCVRTRPGLRRRSSRSSVPRGRVAAPSLGPSLGPGTRRRNSAANPGRSCVARTARIGWDRDFATSRSRLPPGGGGGRGPGSAGARNDGVLQEVAQRGALPTPGRRSILPALSRWRARDRRAPHRESRQRPGSRRMSPWRRRRVAREIREAPWLPAPSEAGDAPPPTIGASHRPRR
jgi:hypothetical protein